MAQTIKTQGIVFKSLKYSETSLILDIYTAELGLKSFIVSGVRKARSKMANVFLPMNIIDLVALNKENTLSRIKEAQYAVPYQKLNLEVVRSTIGVFLIDLCRNAIQEKETNTELYNFISQSLIKLDRDDIDLKYYPLTFTVELATFLGFQMNNNFSAETPYFDLMSGEFTYTDTTHTHMLNDNLSQQLSLLLRNPTELNMDKLTRTLILDALVMYYRLHIEGFRELKSLPVLRMVLGA